MIDEKELIVKNFGYMRIVKNFQKFGWNVYSVVRETTIKKTTEYEAKVDYNGNPYIDTNEKEEKSVLIRIKMNRDENHFINLSKIYFLELLYNLIFLLRRLISIYLPVFSGICLVFVLIGSGDDFFLPEGEFYGIGKAWMLSFFFWIGFIILENILANIAYKILKYR